MINAALFALVAWMLDGFVVSGALLWAGIQVVQGKSPRLLLLISDNQDFGDVGFNGHPVIKTPHLDELAKAGLRLNRFYAAAPVCSLDDRGAQRRPVRDRCGGRRL